MITSAALYRLLWILNITLDIRTICVFLAPLFSSLTTIITYMLTKELKVKILIRYFYYANTINHTFFFYS